MTRNRTRFLPTPTLASRRRFLRTGVAACVAANLAMGGPAAGLSLSSAVAAPPSRDLTVTRIDRVTVEVPYREIPARNMARELPHWKYAELFTVHLQSGHQGVGETLLYYTWGATEDEDVTRAQGRNAAELMWDDSLGAGLQMALFDAVARACDVPIHRLLGEQVHDRTPLSWWNIDTSPADMLAECREAQRLGYRAYKTKGRPWFDLWEQVETCAAGVPDEFKIDMDYNDTLLDAARAVPILKELEQYPEIDIYETPIPQGDIAGNQAIREATRVKIAMHYGNPDPLLAIKQEICDGFIIGGGASTVLRQAHVSAMADKPFWLQLVGTGLTAAWSLHFGAVSTHATWPAVNCHQLYTHPLLTSPIRVEAGFAAVPNQPGLGFDVDWGMVERFRVEKPAQRPDPPRLVESTWPDGRRVIFNHLGGVNFVLKAAQKGETPYFTRGVTTRLYTDDGSAEWRNLYERSRNGPWTIPE